MIPPNDNGHSEESRYDPTNACDPFNQYLEGTPSSYPSLDSVRSQTEGSSSATVSVPMWFTDFILYDLDDPDFQADPMSNLQTSGTARTDISSNWTAIPLLASSPNSVTVSTDTGAQNNTSVYPWPELDDADYTVDLGSNMTKLQWNPTGPALDLYASSHSESEPGEDSEQSSPEHPISTQNDAAGRLSLPRMRYFKCLTCQSHYSSESRLRFARQVYYRPSRLILSSEHLQKSHAPARFVCCTCSRRFKQKKDLRRHQLTHEPSKRPFACSCTKTYARYDGLLRHIAIMVPRPREAGRHKVVEPILS